MFSKIPRLLTRPTSKLSSKSRPLVAWFDRPIRLRVQRCSSNIMIRLQIRSASHAASAGAVAPAAVLHGADVKASGATLFIEQTPVL